MKQEHQQGKTGQPLETNSEVPFPIPEWKSIGELLGWWEKGGKSHE